MLGFIQNHEFYPKPQCVFTNEVQQELVTSTLSSSTPRRGCLPWDHLWARAGKRLAKRGLTVVGFLLLQVEADHGGKNAAVSLALKTAEK